MEACKELAFNFRAPLLEYRRDRSVARMRWETQGAIVATHAHRMVNKVSKRHRTGLYSSWMRGRHHEYLHHHHDHHHEYRHHLHHEYRHHKHHNGFSQDAVDRLAPSE